MAHYKELYNSAVSSNATSYNTACNYYGSGTNMTTLRPTTTVGVMVVPDYAQIGYDALTHGQTGGGNTYFNIEQAYGPSACNTNYSTRLCGAGECSISPSQSYRR